MDDEPSNVLPFPVSREPSEAKAHVAESGSGAGHNDLSSDPHLAELAERLRELEFTDNADAEPQRSVSPEHIGLEPAECKRVEPLRHWSTEDAACVATASAFRGRFGFTLNRTQRFQLLVLVHEDDLTDGEVGLLWRTRNLGFGADRAYNSATRAIGLFGRTMSALMGVLIFMAFLALLRSRSPLPTPASFGLFVAVVSGLIGLMWAGDTLLVRPDQIRRRTVRAAASRQRPAN